MSIKIICHMITTADSRIVTSRWDLPADFDISGVYENTAAQFNAQGWIVGRATMSEYADNISEHQPYDGCVLPTGEHVTAVLSSEVSDVYLYELQQQGISYVFADVQDDETAMLKSALDRIQLMFPHVQLLLLEGGGTINGAFLKAGLIDELSLIVCPLLDGAAEVQNFVNYHGPADPRPGAGQRLELLEHELFAGGTLYLRYRIDR